MNQPEGKSGPDSPRELKARALRLLMRREHGRAELAKQLLSHAESPEVILAEMFAVVTAHAGETPLRDDQAVVVVDRPW